MGSVQLKYYSMYYSNVQGTIRYWFIQEQNNEHTEKYLSVITNTVLQQLNFVRQKDHKSTIHKSIWKNIVSSASNLIRLFICTTKYFVFSE